MRVFHLRYITAREKVVKVISQIVAGDKHMKKLHRPVKVPTKQRLTNAAVFYLSRYAASENSLRQVLDRKIKKAALRDEAFAANYELHKELRSTIETIIEGYRKSGALNDKAFAETKAHSLRRAGKSRSAIRQRLSFKGVSRDIIDQALMHTDEGMESEEAEFAAALAFAKRRKLGPFGAHQTDKDRQRKDVAVLARAGFSLDIVRKIVRGNFE